MCGRFANAEKISISAVRLAAEPTVDDAAWEPSWNCRPGQSLPAVLEDEGGRRLGLMTWGWRREWAKRPLINAKFENLRSSRTWSPALRGRRCLVPCTGWWEWLRDETGSRPFYHRLAEDRPFALAGLWDRDADAGRFAVITAPARSAAARVHDRMPLLLDDERAADWLAGAGPDDCYAAAAWLRLRVHETAPFSQRQDGPGILRPR